MPRSLILAAAAVASFGFVRQAAAQTTLPSSYALPSTSVDKTKPGFLVRTWESTGQPNTLAWTEEQLAGLHGANTADLSVFTDSVYGDKYYDETATINYWDSGGEGNFPNDGTKSNPGLTDDAGHDNFSLEIFTVLDLPAGNLTMGVNSDDGFRVQALAVPDPRSRINAINLGQFDGGRGVTDTTFSIAVQSAGLYPFRMIYEEGGGDAAVEWFTVDSNGDRHLINDATDSASIKAYRQATSTKTVVSSLLPVPGSAGAAPNATVSISLVDGSTPVDTTSVKLTLDGTPLNVTATKNGGITTASYTPSTVFPSGSQHTVTLVYNDGALNTNTYTFTVAAYGTLTPSAKVTPDTTKPGFVWNIFANSGNTTTSNKRAEDALAGLLKDTDGNLLPNNADPAAQGVASGPATAPNPENAPISFVIPTVINLSQTAGDNNGNFPSDEQMPGVPQVDGSTDGMAAEILTYLELPAGVITMGVNSDDGFRTTAGNPQDAFGSILLGEFDAGRGAADSIFNFVVQEAGVYAFRTIWEEGGGGANIEWFTVKADGTKVLVGDTANGGVKAYRAKVGGTDPFVRSVSPSTVARALNVLSSTVNLVLNDGSTAKIDDNSVALKIDGAPVTVTKVRSGNQVSVTYTPTDLQVPTDKHTAEITFKDTSGNFTRTQGWSFYNLKNLVLPAAKVTENFDSYAEDTQPTGWNFWNYTAHCADGRDITSQTSESYENWVLVSVDNMPSIDGANLNVAPGQVFNGQPVDTLASGNVLYAESDGRCGTDALGRGYVGQSQFIISKPFDLSALTNVVLTYNAIYQQNQDSYGGVEYSIDGGTNWLPIAYYIDGVDIVLNADGTINAVATLTAPNNDTSGWKINGKQYGAGANGYGDGVGAPITQSLATYIAPRVDDNNTEGARVEVARLPAASRQKDVRLRFSAMGTDSWYFGVDNIAFYDVGGAPPVGEQPKFNVVTLQGGNLNVSWTGSGTLEQATSVSGPWTAAASQANPQNVSTTGTGAVFFRIHQQ